MTLTDVVRPLKRGAEHLIDALFPPLCQACGEWIPLDAREAVSFCRECWATVQPVPSPYCLRCGTAAPPEAAHLFRAANATERERLRPFDDSSLGAPSAVCRDCRSDPPAFAIARAGGVYEGVLETAVRKLKYGPRPGLARPLAGLLVPILRDRTVWCAGRAALVPVPIHSSRRRERGFNQSEAIALALAAALPDSARPRVVTRALIRTRVTRPQVNLPHAARERNVSGAFAPGPDAASLSGSAAILLDDVMTTGATLDACARVLLHAGATEVRVLCAARDLLAHPRAQPPSVSP